MAKIGLHDLLKLESVVENAKEKSTVAISNGGGLSSKVLDAIVLEDNTITKAVVKYLVSVDKPGHVNFNLVKNIPAGAGLGGGSSNAAASLELLHQIYRIMNKEELNELGKEIGADVPFCLQGGFSICEGIGEIITPINCKLNHSVVIINNGIHVDTGDAYRSLKRTSGNNDSEKYLNKKKRFLSAFENNDFNSIKDLLVNDFENPVCEKYPDILNIKSSLYDHGAEFALMTGSGSTVFGLFLNNNDALTAENDLKKKYKFVIKTQFVD